MEILRWGRRWNPVPPRSCLTALGSMSPVVLDKRVFAPSRDDPPLPAIPTSFLLGLKHPTLCCSTLRGAELNRNWEFSCSLSLRDKHAPVICSFVLHLICRFFSRFSLWNPLCFQQQIPALFWGMTLSAAGFTPAFLLDIGLTCSKMSRGNSRKKTQFFFWWDKVSHK